MIIYDNEVNLEPIQTLLQGLDYKVWKRIILGLLRRLRSSSELVSYLAEHSFNFVPSIAKSAFNACWSWRILISVSWMRS